MSRNGILELGAAPPLAARAQTAVKRPDLTLDVLFERHHESLWRLALRMAGNTLDVGSLGALSPDRQRNALRTWIADRDLPPPATSHVQQVCALLETAPDATACVDWPGAQIRRYRNRLYAMRPLAPPPRDFEDRITPDSSLALPAGLGELRLDTVPGEGLDRERCGERLTVRFRSGGEALRPLGSAHRRELRKLCQESGVVPWMRDRLPLVYAGERLIAVADLWFEHDLSAGQGRPGLRLSWRGHPPLY